MKKKILVIIGTRPEIIRLSCIIQKIEDNFKLILVNTNQNFNKNLNSLFFKELGINKPSYNLKNEYSVKKNSINFISNLLENIDKILAIENPSAVLILGDTNSGLSALCAKKRKIPIFHVEAGNRCFDKNVPEEINRIIIDNLADINMTYSDVAKNNLIKENFDLDKIIKIGSPLPEVFRKYWKNIENSKIINKLKLNKKKYFLVSCHREENVENFEDLKKIFLAINKISNLYKLPVVFSTHPRIKDKLKKINKKLLKNILFHKPFGFFDYVKLQINSKLTISDSGSIVEESNILNFPAINLRNSTERQEGFEKGFVIISSLDPDLILEGVKIVIKRFKESNDNNKHIDYSDYNTSDKIITIIQSYINYVNSKVWLKNIF
jgi:UDP-N-acetylglucosamine 2-epimerase (non-hydrolysing)